MIRKREGFTLVELLVVVAIIIILAAILFPIFAKARDKAQQTRCLNNVKQMGTAVQMYEDDYEGAILPWGLGGNAEYAWGYFWSDKIDVYLKQIKKGSKAGETRGQGEIYRCPSAPTEQATGGNSWQMGKNYGYNRYLSKTTAINEVRYPSQTLRITETASYTPGVDVHNLLPGQDSGYMGGSWYAPTPRASGLNLQSPGWHNGYATVLWFDGHVSSITWQRVMYTDAYQGTTDPNVWCRLSPKEGYTPEG